MTVRTYLPNGSPADTRLLDREAELWETYPAGDGRFILTDLPSGPLDLYVRSRATGVASRVVRVDTSSDRDLGDVRTEATPEGDSEDR